MARTGTCLCGEVRYRVEGEIGPAVACHCQYCRRGHGAPFSLVALVSRSQFVWLEGEEHVRRFHTPGGGTREFCSLCGTRFFNGPRIAPEMISLVLASFDEEWTQSPVAHVNVETKAPWYEIRDGAPQHPRLPNLPFDPEEGRPTDQN